MPNTSLSSVIYVPHGGGPMPLLGDPRQADLTHFLKKIGEQLPSPTAIVVISAHWEAPVATVTGSARPPMFYDYYGFPPESYRIQYPAPGQPQLAERICQLLRDQGISAAVDNQRGYDHGLFVPLKLMYPAAAVPCVQLSLLKNLDAADHITLGKALAPLRGDNILFIGSGMPFHNMNAFRLDNPLYLDADRQFDAWLNDTCTSPEFSAEKRTQRLIDWQQAPAARYCHPREEHLLPLHVCFGIAAVDSPQAENVFRADVIGKRVSAFLWR